MITTIRHSARISFGRFPLGTIALLVFLAGVLVQLEGCGGTKLYVPPENTEAGKLVIINEIYDPGFYVEIDEKDAGFVQEQREIPVKPGKHTVKIFNKETTLADNSLTTTHAFEYQVKVEKNNSSLITLAWDDPHYKKDLDYAKRSIREKEEEKQKHRKTARERGMPY